MPLSLIDPALDPAPRCLDDPAAVGQVLQSLLSQGGELALHPAQAMSEDTPVHMGRLLYVDGPQRRLVLEAAPAVSPPPGSVWCVGLLHGVKTQFAVEAAWTGRSGRVWQASAAWPQALLRLERRLHARIEIPLGQPYHARFQLQGRRYALGINNLSPTGVSLRASHAVASALYVCRNVPSAVLELGSLGSVLTGLVVRTRRSFRSYLLGEQLMIGCSFERLDASGSQRIAQAIALLGGAR